RHTRFSRDWSSDVCSSDLWYMDARQTTFSGTGSVLVAQAVLEVLDPQVEAVGGMTMGADPIAVATATHSGGRLDAFSIRKAEKEDRKSVGEGKGGGRGGRR